MSLFHTSLSEKRPSSVRQPRETCTQSPSHRATRRKGAGAEGKKWDSVKGDGEENVLYLPQPTDHRKDGAAPRAGEGDNRAIGKSYTNITQQEKGSRAKASQSCGTCPEGLKRCGTGGWTPRGQQYDGRWETAFVGAPPLEGEQKGKCVQKIKRLSWSNPRYRKKDDLYSF